MARLMHILMVLDHSFPPDARVENEARSLIEAGFDVTLLSISPSDLPERSIHKGIAVIRDRLSKGKRNKMRGLVGTVPLYNWYLSRKIRTCYAERPFDALHMHDLYLFGGGLEAGRLLGVPVVGDLHENYVEALKTYAWSTQFPGKYLVSIPRWERLERTWVNAVDRLIVVIEEAAERNQALGVPPEKLIVLPNTVKRDAFDADEVDPALVERMRSDLTLVYTGGFDLHRGLESVIDAMPRILERVPGARLVLVGTGRNHADLVAQAEVMGLGGAVRFEGWQPSGLLKSYIAAADIGLVPHLKTPHTDATIPHKLFHYMYMEKPVVVSDCRPLKRIVEEVGAGRVYRAGDAASLAEAVLSLAEAPGDRQAMGKRGRAAVLDRYHWDATAPDLIALYRSLNEAREHGR